MSRIYALSSVKFSGLKLWLCKKSDKYEVCQGEGGAEDDGPLVLGDPLEDEEEGEGGGEDDDGEGEHVEECCHHLPQVRLF